MSYEITVGRVYHFTNLGERDIQRGYSASFYFERKKDALRIAQELRSEGNKLTFEVENNKYEQKKYNKRAQAFVKAVFA